MKQIGSLVNTLTVDAAPIAEQYRRFTKQISRIGVKNKKGQRMQKDVPLYEPTPEQIAAMCLKIQAEWSPERFAKRGRGTYSGVEGIAEARFAEIEVE